MSIEEITGPEWLTSEKPGYLYNRSGGQVLRARFYNHTDAEMAADALNNIAWLRRERDEVKAVLRMIAAHLPDETHTGDACLIIGAPIVRMIRESGVEE